ncbi:hypothetical protein CLOM_g3286 [Closterium sp. NIES-68]|nr:hypothetical protein CLOM_g3286 [Closterium sp. NIES-68]GJP68358.1 hypothetical protein CLOP_g25077 [Closterium sp. NIES-67]
MASAATDRSPAVLLSHNATAVAEAAVQLLPAVTEMGTAGLVYMAAASSAQRVGMVCRVSCASPVSSSLLGALCIAAGSLASAQASQFVHAAFHPHPRESHQHNSGRKQPNASKKQGMGQKSTSNQKHNTWGMWASSTSQHSSSSSSSSSDDSTFTGGMKRARRGLSDLRRRAADELWPSLLPPRQAAAHVVVGLLAFKVLGGRFCNLMPSDVQKRGAFASFSLPANGRRYASGNTRGLIKDLFHRFGCHHCGTRRGEFIADHIPTNRDVHGARWLKQAQQARAQAVAATTGPSTTAALATSTGLTSWPAKFLPLGFLRVFHPSAATSATATATNATATTTATGAKRRPVKAKAGAPLETAAAAAETSSASSTTAAADASQARAKPVSKAGRMPRVSSLPSSTSRLSRVPSMKRSPSLKPSPSLKRSPSLRRLGSTRGAGSEGKGVDGAREGEKRGVMGWLGLSSGKLGDVASQRLYPQCVDCSARQAAALRHQRRTLMPHRRSGWPLPCLFGGFFLHPQLMMQGEGSGPSSTVGAAA